jgi:CHAT domain-containing protein
MAGFPSVVGTLWEVFDSVATDVSTELYRNMRDENGRLNTNKAAEALHWAVCISVDSTDK